MTADVTSAPAVDAVERRVFDALRRALPSADPRTCAELAATARVREYDAGETIVRQGSPMPLTLVVDGHGAFRRTTVNGTEVILGIAPPAYLLGLGSVSNVSSSVEVVALTRCEIASWSGPVLRSAVERDSGLALDVIDRLARSVRMMTRRVDGYLHQDARLRVMRVLARHRDLFFCDRPVLSRSHLPSLVGTSREMTGRVLRELEREGVVVRTGRRGLQLLRPDVLDAYAGPAAPER